MIWYDILYDYNNDTILQCNISVHLAPAGGEANAASGGASVRSDSEVPERYGEPQDPPGPRSARARELLASELARVRLIMTIINNHNHDNNNNNNNNNNNDTIIHFPPNGPSGLGQEVSAGAPARPSSAASRTVGPSRRQRGRRRRRGPAAGMMSCRTPAWPAAVLLPGTVTDQCYSCCFVLELLWPPGHVLFTRGRLLGCSAALRFRRPGEGQAGPPTAQEGGGPGAGPRRPRPRGSGARGGPSPRSRCRESHGSARAV